MARKRREPIDLIEENLEDLENQSLAEAVENLDDELELAEADDEEVTVVEATISDEDEVTVVEEKPKRKRAPRAKKEKAALEAVAEEVAEEISEEIPSVEAPSRGSEPTVAPTPGSPAFDPKDDSMVRQWEMIRTISEAICSSLERASTQIKEMPAQTATAFQENFKAPIARPAPITKIAVAAAVLALVISVLSLSFAQATRQTVLVPEVAAAAVVPPAKPIEVPVAVKPQPVPTARVAEIARVEPKPRIFPRPTTPARPPAHTMRPTPRVVTPPPVKKSRPLKHASATKFHH